MILSCGVRKRNSLTGCLPWLPLSASQNDWPGGVKNERRDRSVICLQIYDSLWTDHCYCHTLGSTQWAGTDQDQDPFPQYIKWPTRGVCLSPEICLSSPYLFFVMMLRAKWKIWPNSNPEKHVFHVPWPPVTSKSPLSLPDTAVFTPGKWIMSHVII